MITSFRLGLRSKLLLTLAGLVFVPFVIIDQLKKTDEFLWQQAEASLQVQLQQLVFSYTESTARQKELAQLDLSVTETRANIYAKPLVDYHRVDGNKVGWTQSGIKPLLLSQDLTAIYIGSNQRKVVFGVEMPQFQPSEQNYVVIHQQVAEVSPETALENKQEEQQELELHRYSFKPFWKFSLSPAGRTSVQYIKDQQSIKDTRIKSRWSSNAETAFIEIDIPKVMLNVPFKLSVYRGSQSDRDNTPLPIQAWSPIIQIIEPLQRHNHWIENLPLQDAIILQTHAKNGQPLAAIEKIDMQQRGRSNAWLASLLETSREQRNAKSIDDLIALVEQQPSSIAMAADNNRTMQLNGVAALTDAQGQLIGYLSLQKDLKPLELAQQSWLASWLKRGFWLMLLIVFLVLSYATVLIYRVRRLANALDHAVDESGQVIAKIKQDNSSDEIGELSRNVKSVVEKLAEQQEYLKRLASKLSHELRTPIAVVKGSLENLAYEIPDPEQQSLKRAEQGIDRLSMILTRMSEATRLEESILKSECEKIAIKKMLDAYIPAIAAANPATPIVLNEVATDAIIEASPELLLQALDKLISNAIDFCDDLLPIQISCEVTKDAIEISVFNAGPPIEGDPTRLFQPLVSERNQQADNQTNLGLGLYVVKLICEYHKADITAINCQKTIGEQLVDGVEFRMRLPVKR